MDMSDKKIQIVTHSGGFHADDVFGVATLMLLLGKENVEVIRSRNPECIRTAEYVLDVGGEYDPERNRFDHHQIGGAGKRENGIEYASFGLLWKKFGAELSGSQEVADDIDRRLIQTIDAHDNGINLAKNVFPRTNVYDISFTTFAFEPTWMEQTRDEYTAFMEAAEWVSVLLVRERQYAQGRISAFKEIQKIYERSADKKILLFPNGSEWHRMLLCEFFQKYPEVLYCVRQHKDGNWQVVCMVDDIRVFKNRKTLPDTWSGKRDQELIQATGISDAVFCHRAGFMCVAQSKEGALKLARLALEA